MWGHLAALVLLLLKGCQTNTVHDTVQTWEKYKADCEHRMRTEPWMSGVFCNRTFDWYVCWGDAAANTTHAEPCPPYLPWYSQVKEGFVYQLCGSDGQWILDETDKPWRDNAQCENADPEQENSEYQSLILFTLRVMYSVGYCVSVTALVVAVFILTQLRRLRCTRNLIHCNLFVSFILRGVSVLARDALLFKEKSMLQAETNFINLSREKTMVGCRVAHIISLYFLTANYYWLLVEGLYLHNLLIVLSFSEDGVLPRYMLLGWGVPILFIVPWVVVRQVYENTQCWERNDNSYHFWIIRSPILLAILINFLIFLRILRILVLKLRANQMRRSDRKYRLAKSTLTLIPLLGIHEAAFNLIPEESAKGGLRYSKLAAELLLSSFQGLLVAILYCFCNKEVQSELRRKRQNSLSGSRPAFLRSPGHASLAPKTSGSRGLDAGQLSGQDQPILS